MIVVDVDQPHQRELLEVDSGGFIAFSADDRYLAGDGAAISDELVGTR